MFASSNLERSHLSFIPFRTERHVKIIIVGNRCLDAIASTKGLLSLHLPSQSMDPDTSMKSLQEGHGNVATSDAITLPNPAREVFEHYSSIPSGEVYAHVMKIVRGPYLYIRAIRLSSKQPYVPSF